MNNCLSKISRLISLKNAIFNTPHYSRVRYLNTQTTKVTPVVPLQFSCKNAWIWQENDKVELPVIHSNIVRLPTGLKWVPPLDELPLYENVIEAPSTENSDISKQAVRMIVIRRKKMKKHKLKKLRKRLKFVRAKLRQRRELKKEKAFQAVLIQQCKEAEAFSAEKYVQERIDKLNEIIIPRYWKGRRLPEFLIREKMGLPPKK